MTLERLDLSNIKVRPIDKVIVKGKTKPVAIFEVLHPHHWMTKDPESLHFYQTAYSLFQKKDFASAMDIFNQLVIANEKDKASLRFRDLCQKYIEHPELVTENFEITTMTEK
jgi:adenylate cyclase